MWWWHFQTGLAALVVLHLPVKTDVSACNFAAPRNYVLNSFCAAHIDQKSFPKRRGWKIISMYFSNVYLLVCLMTRVRHAQQLIRKALFVSSNRNPFHNQSLIKQPGLCARSERIGRSACLVRWGGAGTWSQQHFEINNNQFRSHLEGGGIWQTRQSVKFCKCWFPDASAAAFECISLKDPSDQN